MVWGYGINKEVGIVDEANPGGKLDNLGIEIHTNSLIRFISSTNTPITIGIQGEWGSGKTSLINAIHPKYLTKLLHSAALDQQALSQGNTRCRPFQT